MKRALSAILISALLLLFLSSCAPKKDEVQTKTYYGYFNTYSTVSSYNGESEEEFEAVAQEVESMLSQYNRLYDIYLGYDVNNLKTVNDNAGISPVEVDEKIINLILYSKEMYEMTAGEVNIAMGSVLSLWHDAREKAESGDANLPSTGALEEAARHTSIDDIVIDEENSTVYLRDPHMSLDVGAVGKGYATERIAESLKARGISGYALNIGGNIRLIGTKPTGDGWKVGITNPDKESGGFIETVVLSDTSVVTSGDYERFFTLGGVKYHHIIDKDTLYPSVHFSSVSIILNDSGLADVLSTALFCMTESEGRALIEKLDGVEALWVTPDGKVSMTEGFSRYATASGG